MILGHSVKRQIYRFVTRMVFVTAAGVVAFGTSLAAARGDERPLGLLLSARRSDIERIVVLRVDPWGETIRTVTPDRIEHDFSSEAVVTAADAEGLETIKDAVWREHYTQLGCYGETYVIKTFPASWALLFYGASGDRLGSLYLTRDGLCAVVAEKIYSVDRTLGTFLQRYFAFMNF